MSKIEWTEKTWNPISGCTKISDGCKNCYAEKMANRLKAIGTKGYENGFAVTLHPDRIGEPLNRKKPTMYFVCSMGDIFNEKVPDAFIDAVFATMALCPQHTFQVLTKRVDRMEKYLNEAEKRIEAYFMHDEQTAQFQYPLPNVWLGVTAENQEQADKRIPILLDTPAALRFVSVEPMLDEINLDGLGLEWGGSYYGTKCTKCGNAGSSGIVLGCCEDDIWCGECGSREHIEDLPTLDWVIIGGETGAGARPLQYEWVKDIQEQCKAANVPFFFKKWGKLGQIDKTLVDGHIDGVECRAMPEVTK